eukprot:382198_1
MFRLWFYLLCIYLVQNISGQTANVTCIEEHCGTYSLECEIDDDCRNCLSCLNNCMENIYPNDTSFEHWSTQNCTSYCVATYGDKLFFDYNECLTTYNCITLVPITDNCLNKQLKLIDNFDIDLFTTQGWMIYGRNGVYDCYPCQTFDFKKVNNSYYYYQANYTMPTINNSYNPSYLSTPIVYKPKSAVMNFVYEYQGESHNETWYFIGQDIDQGWTIFYYCGSANTWFYEGGLVTSLNKTLPNGSLKTIENIVNDNGLNFTSWCKVKNDLNGYGCGKDSWY